MPHYLGMRGNIEFPQDVTFVNLASKIVQVYAAMQNFVLGLFLPSSAEQVSRGWNAASQSNRRKRTYE